MMIRYRSALSEKQSPEEAMETCIRAELRPMLATSFALSVGFGVLGFSHFIPVQQFGILSFVVLAVGTITELLVTPSLLVFFQLTPYKKRARSRMLPKPLRPS
jgi:predicted RND superfamily exporter protein